MKLERLVLVALLCVLLAGCARRRNVEYEMSWSSLAEPEHIILTFRDYPNHYVDLRSVELREYLEGLPGPEVTVELEVTTRLGCLERIRTLRIGERSDWNREWGGSGWVNHEKPSPWDEFHCLIPWW